MEPPHGGGFTLLQAPPVHRNVRRRGIGWSFPRSPADEALRLRINALYWDQKDPLPPTVDQKDSLPHDLGGGKTVGGRRDGRRLSSRATLRGIDDLLDPSANNRVDGV